jgi:hypothetical protein
VLAAKCLHTWTAILANTEYVYVYEGKLLYRQSPDQILLGHFQLVTFPTLTLKDTCGYTATYLTVTSRRWLDARMPQNPDVMPVWKSFHLRQKASPADPILISVGRKGPNVTHNVT